jgi:hypothetical protein
MSIDPLADRLMNGRGGRVPRGSEFDQLPEKGGQIEASEQMTPEPFASGTNSDDFNPCPWNIGITCKPRSSAPS